MPVDYSQGKIYKIVGNGKIYVGSTSRPLSSRKAEHSYGFRKWKDGQHCYVSSFDCLSDPECYIEILEMCPCSCVDELRKCERKWIEETECVNRKITGRTHIEYAKSDQAREKVKTRIEANKEEILENKKAYYEANKDAILENKKAYYEANKDAILEKSKAYYEANRDTMIQKQKERDNKKKVEKSIPHLANSIEL